jgi:hypothetical protein
MWLATRKQSRQAGVSAVLWVRFMEIESVFYGMGVVGDLQL